jgi:hypothetical protein
MLEEGYPALCWVIRCEVELLVELAGGLGPRRLMSLLGCGCSLLLLAWWESRAPSCRTWSRSSSAGSSLMTLWKSPPPPRAVWSLGASCSSKFQQVFCQGGRKGSLTSTWCPRAPRVGLCCRKGGAKLKRSRLHRCRQTSRGGQGDYGRNGGGRLLPSFPARGTARGGGMEGRCWWRGTSSLGHAVRRKPVL